ncbi:MAG: WXG100 family type VII secretion target [Bacteroidetes bacterium]|nr:WXG100 family type VII secretion target [Bacteroidota bacterium]
MTDVIRTNYPAMEDMARQCDAVSQRLAQSASNAQKIASQMQNGALQGSPGETYVMALGIFSNRVTRLSDKYREIANDIRRAMTDMMAADQKAGSKF